MVTELAGLDYALPMGVRPFVDAPNVAALSWQLGVDDGVPTNRFVSDIWHRSHGTAPVAAVDATVTPSLVPGVLSHLAERLVAGAGRSEAGPEASVGGVFDAASDAGIGWRLATSAADIEGLPFDADVLERLRASIAAGQVAVVPEATVSIDGTERTGWWLIDTASGRVSDQLDDGRGSVIQEYVEQIDAAITIYKDLKCVFDRVLPLWQQAISHVQALGTGSAVAYSAPAPTFLVSCVPKPS